MADPLYIGYDPDADEGERLAPEVRAEIVKVAPSAVLNNAITTAKLRDAAVTRAKIASGAVGTSEIDAAAVTTAKLPDSAVTTAKIAASAVTPAKCGTGVVTATDSAGNATALAVKFVTSAQYAAIGSPDPNTLYMISA